MVARHRDEVENIEKLLEKPYFARIILQEIRNGKSVNIEYKIGNAANTDCRIIDWRKAPLSKLYYEYKEGEEYFEEIQGKEREGIILMRNTIDANRDAIKQVICKYGTFSKDNDEWTTSSGRVSGQSAGKLPDVLALITSEQFKAITQDAESAVLIQGAAGSGKTTVALYRLAWLLHEDNTNWKTDDVKILVVSNVLKKYIENSLPQLGINAVPVLTIAEWHNNLLKTAFPLFVDDENSIKRTKEICSQSIRRLKESMALFKVIEEIHNENKKNIFNQLEKSISWQLLPSGVKSLFEKKVKTNSPLVSTLEELKIALLKAKQFVKASEGHEAISEASTSIEENLKSAKNYANTLLSALERDDLIIAADETKLINKELVKQAYEFTKVCLETGGLHFTDDALFLRLYQLNYGGIPASNGRTQKYQHLVVDEVQDLGPAELAVIVGSIEKLSGLTLVGDVNQRIRTENSFPGWEALRKYWALDSGLSSFISLNVSHRSTKQIMSLAAKVVDDPPPTEGREGQKPIWFRCYKEDTGIQHAITWLGKALERYPGALTAVICADSAEAKHVLSLLKPSFSHAVRYGDQFNFSFEEGIIVSDPLSVKGLEFTNVLIWNPSIRVYKKDEISRNKLYVSFTRAQDNLSIITWGNHLCYLRGSLAHSSDCISKRKKKKLQTNILVNMGQVYTMYWLKFLLKLSCKYFLLYLFVLIGIA